MFSLYPWLKSYTTHKLEPWSTPCVYLGFSQVHYACQSFYSIHSKFHVSHDVKFSKNIFPFQTIFSHIKNRSFTLTWEVVDTPASPIQSLSTYISASFSSPSSRVFSSVVKLMSPSPPATITRVPVQVIPFLCFLFSLLLRNKPRLLSLPVQRSILLLTTAETK